MQLTYNNQSLLATGCYEAEDPGITRMGKQVIKEMNRVGLVVDMSHSSDRSTIEAADISERPIVVSHANPHEWQPALRNKREKVIRAITENGGLLGFSMYPHHLKNKSNCTLNEFCEMIARTGEKYGIDRIGLGSDLCQDHPDSVVEWMRSGRWSKEIDYGEGTKDNAGFPPMPSWFKDNRDFGQIRKGLRSTGMSTSEIDGVMGDNWHRFFTENFGEK
jgi:microsomal dipeptidase-like Zn-dependent dipeptidase